MDGIVERYIKKAEALLAMFFRRTRENRRRGYPPPLIPARHILHSQDHGHDGWRMVFGKERYEPCKLIFEVAPDMEEAMTRYMTEVMERFHEVQ